MQLNEIRQKYLDFFEKKGHAVIASSSLIPENDPTTLFTGSGMQPMVPYLLGEKHPKGNRIADSQKCFRSPDIEDVGDNRHTTFFEMLGNWSLGDYFKKEQIDWMFEFLTEELKLDPQRIYISVFKGNQSLGIPKDEEAVQLWQEKFKKFGIEAKAVFGAEKKGMQAGRIFYYGEEENWWSRAGVPDNMPVGEPGGPDSEMYFDFGAKRKIHENSPYKDQPCHPACDCGRFLEIGNNVFMQYKKTEQGFEELDNKNIDFGGGLERLTVAVNDEPDVFLADVFHSMRSKLEILAQKNYGANEQETRAFRVILDHLRGAVFLISDGAWPSNKDQGYFTRRLIRRAVRFAYKIKIDENFTAEIAALVIAEYEKAYPQLTKNQELILDELTKEEAKFRRTLKKGLAVFKKIVQQEEADNRKINGKIAFDLYQTYGFPIEMTEELAKENEMDVDLEGFQKEFEAHKDLSRKGAEKKFKGGLADSKEKTIRLHSAAHLMLAGLRKVLGEEVIQKGANITEERLRFDFSHTQKLTDEEVKQVEDFVNQAVSAKADVTMEEMSVEEAEKKGVVGTFQDRYADQVKVYQMGDFSREICGGPHVKNTGEIGKFKITKQESVGAGARRVKAIVE
jgi:alanyl-tRNA synthetase